MSTKLNIRLAHFPSRSPIMLELQVDRTTTVGQLRALVEDKLATEDHCLVRVFARWYLEMRAGEVRRFSELTDADAGSLLSAVGIEDESELYLEGPVIETEQDSIGKALAIVSMQGRKALAQQSSLVQSLLSEIQLLKETQAMQSDVLCSLQESLAEVTADQNQKLEKLAKQVEFIVATQEKQQHNDSQTKQTQELVNSLLIKHSNLPLKALWEVLNDKLSSVELAMAMVMDRRCGLERRSVLAEGEMKGKGSFVLNKDKGGLTPLVMAAWAGRVDVLEALLAAGAEVDAREDQYDFPALHLAAITNDHKAIELLVSYGADVNPEGSSPLHEAAYDCQPDAVEMLIAKGADITKKNAEGQTPLNNFEKREKKLTTKSKKVKDRVRKLLSPK